jgi:DNA modification methylase
MKKFFKSTDEYLENISSLNEKLFLHFRDIIKVDNNLTRQLVSFQANKKRSSYRWYKFKEAFSASLVEYLVSEYRIPKGVVFDPFAGSGTTLFASSKLGYNSEGIELLPIGQQIIKNRINTISNLDQNDLNRIQYWKDNQPWKEFKASEEINTLRITSGAYPEDTEKHLSKFLSAIKQEKDNIRGILFFALLCILESISYTRKDGQYLRWDFRSGRRNGHNTFNKGKIYPFDKAMISKLNEIVNDMHGRNIQLALFTNDKQKFSCGNIKKFDGSCLDILPNIERCQYQAIITSPPYCNRYDYTRTYALEHAILGIKEKELIDLRQNMISCTVENREKELLKINPKWKPAIQSCENNELLQLILEYLEYKKSVKELNNNGIPRMIKGYFYEMACVIQDCFRILKKNGVMFMVNDNVRYAGVSISVDLILSKIAEDLGFNVENILVLPNGKGNSSQQMGVHGREVLRKCVYVWRKMN